MVNNHYSLYFEFLTRTRLKNGSMKNTLMGWQPDQANNRIAFTIGSIVGLCKYLTNIQLSVDFTSKLAEGFIMASLCGFGGMFGKWVFGLIKLYVIKPITDKFKHKNK